MRPAGPPGPARGPPSRRGGDEVGPQEPPLKSPGGRKRFAVPQATEHHADQPRAPGRVFAAEIEHGLHENRGGLGCRRPATVVGSGQGVGALGPEPLKQPPDGAWGEVQTFGDGPDILPVPEAVPDGLTHRQGQVAWHGPFSTNDEGKNEPLL
jgi:hypothetical protein